MDVRTGRIVDASLVQTMDPGERRHFIPMEVPPSPAQQKRGKVGRNDPCPCGSGKKFKRCHLTNTPFAKPGA